MWPTAAHWSGPNTPFPLLLSSLPLLVLPGTIGRKSASVGVALSQSLTAKDGVYCLLELPHARTLRRSLHSPGRGPDVLED